MRCSRCGTEFVGNFCPECGTRAEANSQTMRKKTKRAKRKKPFFLRWWFVLLVIVAVVYMAGQNGEFDDKVNWNDINLREIISNASTNVEKLYKNSDKESTNGGATKPIGTKAEEQMAEQTTPVETTQTDRGDTGISPEFKAAMDAYESFYVEYCDFMKEFDKNQTDVVLLLKYTEMISKVAEMDRAFSAWEDEELNGEELKYYVDVSNRVAKMLIDVAQ